MFALKHDDVNRLVSLAMVSVLGGCVTPAVELGQAAPEGSTVELGRAVRVGQLVATPQMVAEDSRCPENVRCVWAGRLIVSTRIDGAGWSEIAPLTLGEKYAVHGTAITLVNALPEKQAGKETAARDYRFAFEGGR